MGEFVLPAGVVLTSFSPSFVPVVGYDETIGIEEDKNEYEPRVYPDDFFVGRTEPAFGSGSAFTARVTISGPEAYRYNSVGILESDEVKDGVRTVVWSTDRKVRFFNVVAGKWADPFWQWWDVLMLWLALIHGANGMRTIVNDYTSPGTIQRLLKVALFAAAAVLIVLGTLVVFTFDPCPAGAPADLLPSFCPAA